MAVQLDNLPSRPECQQPMTCHFERSEKSRLDLRNRIEHPGIGLYTAETQRTRRKKILDKKYSGLCELCASVVNTSTREARIIQHLNPSD
jgi:hypothetical protein